MRASENLHCRSQIARCETTAMSLIWPCLNLGVQLAYHSSQRPCPVMTCCSTYLKENSIQYPLYLLEEDFSKALKPIKCLALWSHSKMVLGSIPFWGTVRCLGGLQGLSVWSLGVLPVLTWVSSTRNLDTNLNAEQTALLPVDLVRHGGFWLPLEEGLQKGGKAQREMYWWTIKLLCVRVCVCVPHIA